MSECEQTGQRLQAALDGELGTAERAEMAAHLDACPACRRLAAAYERLFAALGEPELPEPPPGLAARVLRRVAAADQRRRRWQAWVAAAAVVAVSCAAVLLVRADLTVAAWAWAGELDGLEFWRGLSAAYAELGTSVAAEGSGWLRSVPGGAAAALVLAALAAGDLVLVFRWRTLARLNGREQARTLR